MSDKKNLIDVLDKGFVELIDYMGDDDRIVQSARVSYDAKDTQDAMKFVARLWQSGHTSPFEQVVLTYHIKSPIFVARQMMRHRTARVNELSLRYTESKLEFYTPDDERLGDHPDTARGYLETLYTQIRGVYKTLLASHVRKEVARCVLPVSTYTEFYFQMDLHNLLHFFELRCAKSAQWETWQYANAMKEFARQVCPAAISAFDRT